MFKLPLFTLAFWLFGSTFVASQKTSDNTQYIDQGAQKLTCKILALQKKGYLTEQILEILKKELQQISAQETHALHLDDNQKKSLKILVSICLGLTGIYLVYKLYKKLQENKAPTPRSNPAAREAQPLTADELVDDLLEPIRRETEERDNAARIQEARERAEITRLHGEARAAAMLEETEIGRRRQELRRRQEGQRFDEQSAIENLQRLDARRRFEAQATAETQALDERIERINIEIQRRERES